MKTILKSLFVLALAVATIHCSGESLIDADTDPNADTSALGTLNLGALHSLEDGTALAAGLDGHKELSTDLGFDLHLSEAQINWSRLKLISSGADPECEGGADQDVALDQVEDILGEDLVATSLGEIEIPLTAYCSFEVTIAPTPVSALKLHEGEDPGTGKVGIGVSFHVEGEWSKDAASGTFHFESTEPVTVSGEFLAEEDGQLIPHPLHFHGSETEIELNFGNHYDAWFAGIDFGADDEATQLSKFVENLKSGLHRESSHH